MQLQPLSVFGKRRNENGLQNLPKVSVVTNRYPIKWRRQDFKFFRVYEIGTLPVVQKDSYKVFRAAQKLMPQEVKKAIKYELLGRKAYTLWYTAPNQLLEQQTGYISQSKPPSYSITIDDKQYTITLRLVKQCSLAQKQSVTLIEQFMNIYFKTKILSTQKIKQLSRNTFFPKGEPYFTQHKEGIQARIGFRVTLQYLEIQLYCDINNKLKYMNKLTMLEEMKQHRRKARNYIGYRVITTYGKEKTYVIVDVENGMCPASKFIKNDGKQTTFVQYFKTNYGIDVIDLKQPLLKVKSLKKQRLQLKGQTYEQFKNNIYLIPQLVKLTDVQRVRTYNRKHYISPNRCISNANDFIQIVNKSQSEFVIDLQSRRQQAILLPDPEISVNQFTRCLPKNGEFTIDTAISEPLRLKHVLVVHSVGDTPQLIQQDRNIIRNTMNLFNYAGKRNQISIAQWYTIEMLSQCSEQAWTLEIEKYIQEHSKPDIVLIALKDEQENFYEWIKMDLTFKYEVESQAFYLSKFTQDQKSRTTIAGKLMKQIAAKQNCTLWKIQPKESLAQKMILMIGISIQRLGSHFECVIVRNTDRYISKFKTDVHYLESKEIPADILKSIFTKCIKQFTKQQKCKPTTIIVYRLGLNNERFCEQHLENESKLLIQCCKFGQATVYIQVKSRPQQKMWQSGGRQENTFLPNVFNPQVGTLIRGQSDSEFYLVPYKTDFGSVQPAYYRVYWNESKVPISLIVQLTYSQTYMYFNWEGSVRLPAVLMNCLKVHKFVKPEDEEIKLVTFKSLVYL